MATMQVLLMDEMEHLGDMGEVVTVKRGYGRNFLLPRGIAVLATRGNLHQMEHHKRIVAEKMKRIRLASEDLAKNLSAQELEFVERAGESGTLYGAVTSIDIARELAARGFEVERRKISLAAPLKEVGTTTVEIHLPQGVVATVKVVVRAEAVAAEAPAEAAAPAEVAAE
ncbi:MAG: 50S ribosomal protein L9 [Nitrospirae bacterium CG18_big_fil_WC_8_21_14_2_50_70_55]|nr:50S ribosomal protein L9 [Deltaproteobacteria bacterium]PIQ06644.1 MAG: 50S ribosomal protein L9 [Nitrospirae bacterium CG18_big_fil_WC_8_21_14_2_50_70_55]PIU78426.1 MAG: 50S ribosomal protein L9 [Nitrospirae bacterium CG06_land_8_20_14_3_00_70_43]PIW84039.1 MAG: 50S ribosomal protein L9 [Nitrospirae bacterium CG_4_8_14_3_um_filter_70_85]PIX84170.1 MAG: 50S ribosomal protein L9 [Nitrospirae bacterium CG_4_10_14_3_um_filter_70_108]PJB96079.1 MAG: 50S ribosomal protein L9 [Nitrospirae bacteri